MLNVSLLILYTVDEGFDSLCFSYFDWVVVRFWELFVHSVEVCCGFDCFEELGLFAAFKVVSFHAFYYNRQGKDFFA